MTTPRPDRDDVTARLARRRLGDAWLAAALEPPAAAEDRVTGALAAFDRNFPPPAPAPAPGRGPTRRRWLAAAGSAALAAGVAGTAVLFTPRRATAAEVVRRLADAEAGAVAKAGPRAFDLAVTFAGGRRRTGTLTVFGPRAFTVDLDPLRPRGGGLAFGSNGETSWVRGPAGFTRTFDRPAAWYEDPAAADLRLLPTSPADVLAKLRDGYRLRFGGPAPGGARPVVAERTAGRGPARVVLTPDDTGTRTERLVVEWPDDAPTRVRRAVMGAAR